MPYTKITEQQTDQIISEYLRKTATSSVAWTEHLPLHMRLISGGLAQASQTTIEGALIQLELLGAWALGRATFKASKAWRHRLATNIIVLGAYVCNLFFFICILYVLLCVLVQFWLWKESMFTVR